MCRPPIRNATATLLPAFGRLLADVEHLATNLAEGAAHLLGPVDEVGERHGVPLMVTGSAYQAPKAASAASRSS